MKVQTDDDFDRLVPRVRDKSTNHPKSTTDFSEPSREFETFTTPNENSPFVVFSWEFLRRNRFYQALVDKRKNALPASTWGFRTHPDQPKIHGLTKLKPYWEDYDQGEPPNWVGLDTFAQRLDASISDQAREVTLKLLPGQVVVIFDSYGVLNGKSPVDLQAQVVVEHLARLEAEKYGEKTRNNKSVHKKVLLRRWNLMVLMLDKGMEFDKAAKDMGYATKKATRTGFKRSAATFVPAFLRAENEPVTTAYEDASYIYGCIYRHGYIDLLASPHSYYVENERLLPLEFSESYRAMLKEFE